MTKTAQALAHWTNADRDEALRRARDADPSMAFMMRLLALCTLPRTDPGAKRDRYVRRNGAFTLVMVAGGERPKLPFGSIPRLLLAWICSEAVRRQSRTLVLGRSLAEFMEELGMNSDRGGSRSDRARLRNQMDRLFSCQVELIHEDRHSKRFVASRIADSGEFWWDPRRPQAQSLWASTIELGEKFFNEIMACPVPLDMNVLHAMRRSPLGLDLYLWVTYRLYRLSAPCHVSWRQIYAQFGVHPNRTDRRTIDAFRTDVLRELARLKKAWPGLDYRLPRGRLELRPTPPLIAARPAPRRPGAARVRAGDTDHETLRREAVRLLTDQPDLRASGRTGDLAEALKTAAARTGIRYDAEMITAAIRAAQAILAKRRSGSP